MLIIYCDESQSHASDNMISWHKIMEMCSCFEDILLRDRQSDSMCMSCNGGGVERGETQSW